MPGYRSFSFGATALGLLGSRLAQTSDGLVLAVLAPVLFAAAPAGDERDRTFVDEARLQA